MEVTWLEISALLISAFVSIFAFVRWNYRYWERKNVPYLKPSLPMGNFECPWAIKKGINNTLLDIYKDLRALGGKYGGIYSALRPVFVPLDLDLLKCIMIKDFQYFVDRGVYYNEKSDPLSANIFRIEGNKWRSLRTRLSPTFTTGKMKYMFDTVLNCGATLESEIEKLYINKKPVDVKEIAALFTTNVIGSCAFGLDCDVFANPNNEFRSHTRDFFRGGLTRTLRNQAVLSFPKLCGMLGIRFFPKGITNFYADVIKEVLELREAGKIQRNDFVQILLEIKNGATKKEDSFTFDEIAAQALVFFLAGFETSSSTMTFAFYEMAQNKEVQDKVRDEVRRVIAKYGGKITYQAIAEMSYLTQVFDETLRKYPILPVLDRIVTKDYEVPGTDLVLPKGTKILIPLQALQNDPEYFPNPEKFDPERFSPENKTSHHVCAYMPFGEGPRICIGLRFGLMQAKIGMALMLKNYSYTLHSGKPDIVINGNIHLLTPLGQVLLNIEKVH